jgi:Transposase
MSTGNDTSGSRPLSTSRRDWRGRWARIDWAAEKHDVLIEHPAGGELLATTFRHDEDRVSMLCAALVCFDVAVVAIERPDGLLVDRPLDVGVRVLVLHPNQVKAARDRFRASGGESDRFDRFVLCELARTDRHRFRIPEPDSDAIKALPGVDAGAGGSRRCPLALANQLLALVPDAVRVVIVAGQFSRTSMCSAPMRACSLRRDGTGAQPPSLRLAPRGWIAPVKSCRSVRGRRADDPVDRAPPRTPSRTLRCPQAGAPAVGR